MTRLLKKLCNLFDRVGRWYFGTGNRPYVSNTKKKKK